VVVEVMVVVASVGLGVAWEPAGAALFFAVPVLVVSVEGVPV
jgi:hypothetical protein